jgi:hypothetical protein
LYQIYIKDIIFKRVIPPKYLYHTFFDENNEKTQSILTYGLIPKNYKQGNFNIAIKAHPEAIFLSDIHELFFGNKVVKIDTSKIKNKFYIDINNEKAFMTFEPIPPEAIIEINNKNKLKNEN